jgi:hypothetical protein
MGSEMSAIRVVLDSYGVDAGMHCRRRKRIRTILDVSAKYIQSTR